METTTTPRERAHAARGGEAPSADARPAWPPRWATPGAPGAPAPSGRIELVLGPMFSGKTEELVRRGRLAAIAGQPVAIIKYRGDTRYEAGAAIATHAGRRQPSAPGSALCAPIRVVEADCLAEVVACESVVCVDEGQFYADLPEVCERWAHEGRVVVVAALDGDFARRPFGRVGELLPLCESVVKLQGVCVVCKQPAAFSQRLSDSRAVIEIAGLELYRAVCRACHDPRPCAE